MATKTTKAQSKKATIKKASTNNASAKKPARARKQAGPEGVPRQAEHEAPTDKKRANNAANEGHAKTKGVAARPKGKDAVRANVAADAGNGKPKRLSALDAAARVLADAPAEGMGAKDLIAEIKTRGLWASPGGKTPAATLYAAMTREIAKKGDGARFRKVARGRFTLATG